MRRLKDGRVKSLSFGRSGWWFVGMWSCGFLRATLMSFSSRGRGPSLRMASCRYGQGSTKFNKTHSSQQVTNILCTKSHFNWQWCRNMTSKDFTSKRKKIWCCYRLCGGARKSLRIDVGYKFNVTKRVSVFLENHIVSSWPTSRCPRVQKRLKSFI